MKRYKPLIRWSEELRFSDLKKSAGMSDFTKEKRKDRNKAGQLENKTAKLIDVQINKKEDWIKFLFVTIPTDIYPPDNISQNVDPISNFKLHPTEQYTMELKILKFFSLLDTTPNEITNKDLEDVLEVANVQVFCDDPSFHWQGDNYISSMFGASVYPTSIAPKFWNKYHNDDNFLCKHLGGLINQIKSFIPQMRTKIKKKLGLTKK